MARPQHNFLLLVFVLGVILVCNASSFEARKLMGAVPYLDSLILSALPKGLPPPSAPSKKGHKEVPVDQRLLTLRNYARTDRLLRQSVPSPGVGH
ncbi:hypothetical protein CDL15_Pgr002347 [Punica granatum]|uniref:Uncharacterized protein n=1 Tax=Punica granatum TaxID=22663 RepID=A0A218XUQ7_PUNGR|nr:hypothetical protein CDL15_Pgr002347 [Punica granatum]PKI52768.1 hypothetical protein CRG98_026843 [Punica granatum]